jgi:3-hydroxy-9,10-secoandrosta-1,3,5(10)-triene-9,17-dione monooxygenase
MQPTPATARKPIPVPEPNLTPKQMVARAVSLRPKLRAQQDENDERGAYSPELHEDFIKAGFYRCTQPKMFGGYEFDLATYYKTMTEIAAGHPGVGWCLGLAASHAFEVASHWPEQAQIDFFGKDGHFIAPHRAPPLGTLTPVDGGYMMSGTWDYCSGVPYATHFIGGAFIKRDGEPPVTPMP